MKFNEGDMVTFVGESKFNHIIEQHGVNHNFQRDAPYLFGKKVKVTHVFKDGSVQIASRKLMCSTDWVISTTHTQLGMIYIGHNVTIDERLFEL